MLTDIGLSDADLAGIQTSVKIIYAEKDMIKEEHIQHIASQIPGATLDKIPGCTHMNIYKKMETAELMKRYFMDEAGEAA